MRGEGGKGEEVFCHQRRQTLFYFIQQSRPSRELTASRLSVTCGPRVALTVYSIKIHSSPESRGSRVFIYHTLMHTHAHAHTHTHKQINKQTHYISVHTNITTVLRSVTLPFTGGKHGHRSSKSTWNQRDRREQ